jgi:hypothetical protein
VAAGSTPRRRSSSTTSRRGRPTSTPTRPRRCATRTRLWSGIGSCGGAGSPRTSSRLDRSRAVHLVVVPTLYLVDDEAAEAVAAAARAGASVLVTYASGLVDSTTTCGSAATRGHSRDVLGVRSEALSPLLEEEVVTLDDGTTCNLWTEDVRLAGCRRVRHLVDTLVAEAGLRPEVGDLPEGVEVVRQHAEDGSAFLFVLNHTAEPVVVPAGGT